MTRLEQHPLLVGEPPVPEVPEPFVRTRAHEVRHTERGHRDLFETEVPSQLRALEHELGIELLRRRADLGLFHRIVDCREGDTRLVIPLFRASVVRSPVGRVHQEDQPFAALGSGLQSTDRLGGQLVLFVVLEKHRGRVGVQKVVLEDFSPRVVPLANKHVHVGFFRGRDD